MSLVEIFQPGMRHWKEFQDWQADKVTEASAPGPGPGIPKIDLDKGIIIIEEPALPSDEDK